MAKKKIEGITVEIGGDTKGLTEAIRGANKDSRALQSELRSVNRLLKGDPKNIVLLRQKQELLKQSVEGTRQKLEMLRSKQEEVNAAFKKGDITADQYRDFQREIIVTEKKLSGLEREQKKFNSAALQLSVAKIKSFGEGMQKAGKKIMPVSMAVGALTGAAMKMGAEFDKAMAKVNTIADTTQVPLGTLRKEILKLSNDTGIAASEIADNVYNAISAGQKTGDAVNFVRNSTRLAKAGFAEAGDSLDLLTSILNAYGFKAKEVSRVSDILITTQNLGKTTVGELAKTMGKVIPTAKASGVAIEQLAAGYAIMTAEGVRTKETTTYMNSMLNELSKSGTKVSDTLKEKTGKSFQELMKEGKTVGDALQILKQAADEQGLSFMDMFGSSEAAKAGLILLGDSSSKFNSMLKKMKASTGATSEAMKKLETPASLLKKSLNRLKNIGIELGSSLLTALMPAIKSVASGMQKLVGAVNRMSPAAKKAIGVIALVVAAAGPLLVGLGKVVVLVGQLVSIMPMLAPIFAALSGPIGLAAAALGGFVAVMGVVALSSKESADKQVQANNEVIKSIDGVIASYEKKVKAAEDTAAKELAQMGYIEGLKSELDSIVDANGKVKSGYEERARFIVGELTQATGIELNLVGQVVEGYGQLGASIDDYIQKKKAEIILKAEEEKYTAAMQSLQEEIKLQKELSVQIAETERQLEASHSRGRGRDGEKIRSLAELKAKRDEVTQKVIEQTGVIEEFENLQRASAEGNYDAINAALTGYGSKVEEVQNLSRDELEKSREKAEIELAEMKRLYEETGDTIYQTEIIQGQQYIGAIDSKLAAMDNSTRAGGEKVKQSTKEYTDMTLSIVRGDIWQYGQTGAEKGSQHASGISSKQSAARAAGSGLAGAALEGTDSKTSQHRSVGRAIGAGVESGIWDKVGDVIKAAKGMARKALKAAMKYLGINSPSKVFNKIVGKSIPEGTALGIKKNVGSVVGSVHDMSRKALETAKRGARKIGAAYSDGIKVDPRAARQRLALMTDNLRSHAVPDINMAIGRAPIRVEQRARLEVEAANARLTERLDVMAAKLDKYLPKIGTGQMILDTGQMVGEMAPKMDVELGRLQKRRRRL